MALNVAYVSGSCIVCIILTGFCVILQGTSVLGSCTQHNSISMCTSGEVSGLLVYVDFKSVPRHEKNIACFCYVFIEQTNRMTITYTLPGNYMYKWPLDTVVEVDKLKLQNFTRKWWPITSDSYKPIHYKGETGNVSPPLCLAIVAENRTISLSVICRINGDISIPTKAASTPTSTDHTTEPSPPGSTSAGSGTAGTTERLSATEKPSDLDIGTLTGAAGGGLVVIVVVVIVIVIVCKRQRTPKKLKQPDTNMKYNANSQEDDTYNVENAMYVSADLDSATYDKPDSEVTYDTADDVMYDKSTSGHLYDSTNTKPQRTAVQNEYSSVLTNKRNNPHPSDNGDTYNRINHGANPRTAPPDDTYDTTQY